MVILVTAGIIAICAVVVLLRPNTINVLSDADRKRMNPKRTGRVAFVGLMTTALIMAVLYLSAYAMS